MKRNNIYIRKTLILLCTISAPSLYLFSSHYNPRIPAGKRPLGYTGPKNMRQKPIAQIIPTKTSTNKIETATPAATNEETEQALEEKSDEAPETENEPTTITDIKEVQAAAPTSGWFSQAYAAITPVILVTLNKALGTGIGASTKSLIKQFMARQAFTSLKNDISVKAENLVTMGIIDENLQKQGFSTNIPTEVKLDLAKATLFKQSKIDPDQMEKQTSLSSIFGQAIYMGMLNTIIPMMGTLIGLGATMALQALMPTDK